jgi:hypothetical protein
VVNLEATADRLAARGGSDAAVRRHHRLWLGLTSEQAAQLKQVATDWARQNASLDIQAGSARLALQRARRESPSAAVTPEEQQLGAIAAQQIALVRSARATLASAFGPAGFAYFESILRRYAVSRVAAPQPLAACAQQCVFPTGESSQLDATDDWATDFGTGPRTGGEYEGVLNVPGGANLAGRSVDEGWGPTSDGCFASYGKLAGVAQFNFTADGPWAVGTKYQDNSALAQNHYGIDYIWINSNSAYNYVYNGILVATGYSGDGDCTLSATQSMYIDDCNGNTNYAAPYDSHLSGWTITAYGTPVPLAEGVVCATRAGVQACPQI